MPSSVNAWYRGEHTHFYPKKADSLSPAWYRANVCQHITPSTPLITKETQVTTMGSCFAAHIKNYLRRHGYKVDNHNALLTRFGAGSVNVYTLLQQLRWAYGVEEYDEELWIADKNVVAEHGGSSRAGAREVFDQTGVLILTLGLSEVWYNKETGGVFWRAIPARMFNKEKHGFRYLTHAETKVRLLDIVSTVRENIGDIPIIFSVSPVRLAATFRRMSAVVANSSSKATLRSAVNEVLDETDSNVWYWPSYEMIRVHPDAYLGDNTHPQIPIIHKVMRAFLMEWTDHAD